MVTTPDAIPEPPTRAERARASTESAVRLIIAGSDVGAIRRIILYVIAAVSLLVLATGAGTGGLIVGGFGLVALMLTAMSDNLA
jgi:hypothetical protein